MGYNVAIDGPAGAGKSTIAKLVAKEKGYIYVDTGAMYRGLAIHFLNKGIEPGETDKVIEACKDAEVTIAYEDGVQHVYLNGNDISSRLRNEEVGNMASVTSAIPEVRKKLLELQQNLAKTQDVIMDGRDIGTCVLPGADVKDLSDRQCRDAGRRDGMTNLRKKARTAIWKKSHTTSKNVITEI